VCSQQWIIYKSKLYFLILKTQNIGLIYIATTIRSKYIQQRSQYLKYKIFYIFLIQDMSIYIVDKLHRIKHTETNKINE